ncbi:MAG: hypothetical protein HXY24_14955 [Rubrivivax sp.]|nr:hypothetical protein [Rubrivivax sp.]
MLALLLLVGLLPSPAVAAPKDQPAAQAVAAEKPGGPDLRGSATAAALVFFAALAGVVLVVARTAFSVAALAAWPTGVANAAGWARSRPWLCFGWGVPLELIGLILIPNGWNAGWLPRLVASLVLAVGFLAWVFGFAALAEVFGERIYALRHGSPPSRLAAVIVGSAVLTTICVTLPGWLLLAFFVLPCSLGAARFLRSLPPQGLVAFPVEAEAGPAAPSAAT